MLTMVIRPVMRHGLVLLVSLLGVTPHAAVSASATALPKTYDIPAEHQAGLQQFQALCSVCHGAWAEGTAQGPTLIHEVYVPWHHSDKTFYGAVANGVRAHHWQFGDMPPVPGVAVEEVTAMIGLIRWLQIENGIGLEDDLDEESDESMEGMDHGR